MGAIEDTRRVLQDFLAPELRAISVRLDAVEKRLDGIDRKFEHIDQRFERVDQKFEEAEQRAEKRHDELMGEMRRLYDLSSIQERLTRLESRHEMHQ